tara:strand:+ start:42 stop:326 length:285 start_codon:yes stop_codon:yes gene_type:complete
MSNIKKKDDSKIISNLLRLTKTFFILLKLSLLTKKNKKQKNTIEKFVIIVYEKLFEKSNFELVAVLSNIKKPGKENKKQINNILKKVISDVFLK